MGGGSAKLVQIPYTPQLLRPIIVLKTQHASCRTTVSSQYMVPEKCWILDFVLICCSSSSPSSLYILVLFEKSLFSNAYHHHHRHLDAGVSVCSAGRCSLVMFRFFLFFIAVMYFDAACKNVSHHHHQHLDAGVSVCSAGRWNPVISTQAPLGKPPFIGNPLIYTPPARESRPPIHRFAVRPA